MATIKFLAGFICLAFIGRNWDIGSRIIKEKEETGYERVIRIARSQIGIRETACQNCGIAIAGYLTAVGFKTPQPYCAAFVSWVHGKAGYLRPRTAWSPSLFPASRLTKEPKPGIVYGLYYPSLKRIGHCGLLESLQGDFLQGIEANTNVAGSREGDGVWRKIRHKRTIHCYADWVK
ncbi:hypothetical protein D3C86_1421600 [compost metagenome]